jgi:hypothetical protein
LAGGSLSSLRCPAPFDKFAGNEFGRPKVARRGCAGMARIKVQGSPCVLRGPAIHASPGRTSLCARSPGKRSTGSFAETGSPLANPLAGVFFSAVRPWTVLKSSQTILGLALATPNPAARPLDKDLNPARPPRPTIFG